MCNETPPISSSLSVSNCDPEGYVLRGRTYAFSFSNRTQTSIPPIQLPEQFVGMQDVLTAAKKVYSDLSTEELTNKIRTLNDKLTDELKGYARKNNIDISNFPPPLVLIQQTDSKGINFYVCFKRAEIQSQQQNCLTGSVFMKPTLKESTLGSGAEKDAFAAYHLEGKDGKPQPNVLILARSLDKKPYDDRTNVEFREQMQKELTNRYILASAIKLSKDNGLENNYSGLPVNMVEPVVIKLPSGNIVYGYKENYASMNGEAFAGKQSHKSLIERLDFAKTSAIALNALHDLGFIHGDNKLGNVNVFDGNQFMFSDFSTMEKDSTPNPDKTWREQYIPGTQIMRDSSGSRKKSDIFAEGIKQFCSLTGQDYMFTALACRKYELNDDACIDAMFEDTERLSPKDKQCNQWCKDVYAEEFLNIQINSTIKSIERWKETLIGCNPQDKLNLNKAEQNLVMYGENLLEYRERTSAAKKMTVNAKEALRKLDLEPLVKIWGADQGNQIYIKLVDLMEGKLTLDLWIKYLGTLKVPVSLTGQDPLWDYHHPEETTTSAV